MKSKLGIIIKGGLLMYRVKIIIEKIKDIFFLIFLLLIFWMITETLNYDVLHFIELTWNMIKLIFN